MGFEVEKINHPKNQLELSKTPKTPRRLMAALRASLELCISNTTTIPITGLENLEVVPPDKHLIIATSHISDIDLQTAVYVLGRYRQILITNQSTQHHLNQDPVTRIGIAIAGKRSFRPITHQKKEGQTKGSFNPADYPPMVDDLNQGATIALAAHNPAYDGILPDRAGIGAVYLAQLADPKKTVILPVAVVLTPDKNIVAHKKTDLIKNLFNRPRAEVRIGKPISLEKLDISPLSSLENSHYQEVLTQLREQGKQIMRALAKLLPEEKRGPWR